MGCPGACEARHRTLARFLNLPPPRKPKNPNPLPRPQLRSAKIRKPRPPPPLNRLPPHRLPSRTPPHPPLSSSHPPRIATQSRRKPDEYSFTPGFKALLSRTAIEEIFMSHPLARTH